MARKRRDATHAARLSRRCCRRQVCVGVVWAAVPAVLTASQSQLARPRGIAGATAALCAYVLMGCYVCSGFFFWLFIFSYGVMVIVLACITSPLFNVAVCCYAATFQLDCWGVIYNSARTIYIYTSPDIVPAFKLYSKILCILAIQLIYIPHLNTYSSLFPDTSLYIPLFLWRAFVFYLQHWYQNMVVKVQYFNTTVCVREREYN
jgi:hypothetical protein